MPDADAPSFARVEKYDPNVDATDIRGQFSGGERVSVPH